MELKTAPHMATIKRDINPHRDPLPPFEKVFGEVSAGTLKFGGFNNLRRCLDPSMISILSPI